MIGQYRIILSAEAAGAVLKPSGGNCAVLPYYSNAKAVQKQVANAGKMLYTQYIPMVAFDKYALFGNRYPKGE